MVRLFWVLSLNLIDFNFHNMRYFALLFVMAITVATASTASAQPYKTGVTPQNNSVYKASMDGWLVSIDEANALSAKTGKPILANFTGTDWCGWCIKLKREVFTTPEFKAWAKEHVILLELDFPRRFQLPDNIKQQNAQLQQVFGVRGYPTIWMFTINNNDQGQAQINAIGKTGYVAGGPSKFIATLEQFMIN